MPKTKGESIFFTAITAWMMVYVMTLYNIAIAMGSFTNAAFLIALKEMWIEYIIIALLAAPQSKYAAFHSRQALKLDIVSTLLLLVSAVLAFTFIVPIAGAVCIAILFVVRIICFFQVCSGKAKDAAIIGKLPFLK